MPYAPDTAGFGCPDDAASTAQAAANAARAADPKDPQPPALPRPRMPLSQRAKIFIPFDPLKGYQEALRQKEREAEAAHHERIHLEDAP